jgi:hypothetical protein
VSDLGKLLETEDPEAKVKELEQELSRLRDQLRWQEALQEPSIAKVKVPKQTKQGQHRAIALQLMSDWHAGERVNREQTNGLNEYAPSICKARVERVFDYSLWRVNVDRSDIRIDTYILAFLGDLMTGYIHEDLRRTNVLSPVNEALFLRPLIVAGIDGLLKSGDFRQIVVPCVYGNHGRLNPNRELISAGADDSLEWMIYQQLAQHYADEERVEFKVAVTPVYYVVVDRYVLRATHGGHGFGYNRGIGGVQVPLNRTIPRWDAGHRADLTVLGHYHQTYTALRSFGNGSLIGYNAYAAAKGFQPEPAQQTLIMLDSVSKQVLGSHAIFGESPDEWLKRQGRVLG